MAIFGYVVILLAASLLAVWAVMETKHPMVAFVVFTGVLVAGCAAMYAMGIGGDEADAGPESQP